MFSWIAVLLLVMVDVELGRQLVVISQWQLMEVLLSGQKALDRSKWRKPIFTFVPSDLGSVEQPLQDNQIALSGSFGS